MSRVEGRNPVYEALRANRATKIILSYEAIIDEKLSEILTLSKENDIPVEYLKKAKLDEISTTGHHQGLIAVINPIKDENLENLISKSDRKVCFLILNRINDPHNLGAILRVAEATKVDAIITPKKGSVDVTPAVHRVSMGGSMYIQVFKRNIYTILKLLKREGIQIICVDPSGSTDLFSEDLTGSVAFVFGGEDRGINPNLMEKCERRINIPMFGQLESLNVSTSVAIVLYERIRQQISQKNK